MLYLILKSIHIVAVIFWVGSLSLVCIVTSTARLNQEQMRLATRITESAIGVTWLAGIVLVVMGGWYGSTWWYVKVLLVIVVSAIHTVFHRRWKSDNAEDVLTNNSVPVFLFVLTLLIVLLVVFKQPA